MKFNFSIQGLRGDQKKIHRFLEILPGATSWAILIGMTAFTFSKPVVAAVLIIAFDFYWLLRLFYVTFFLILSYFLLFSEKETDWMHQITSVDRLKAHSAPSSSLNTQKLFKKSISAWRRAKEIKQLIKSGVSAPASDDLWHLVIIPVMKESAEIIEPGIQSLRRQKFPSRRILVVYALEERASLEVQQGVSALAKKYKDSFFDLLVITHPDGLPGEARVKGANTTYAAKKAADYFRDHKIKFENIIASCFDADTVVPPEYFSCLSYHFMVCPFRTRASFQPIPVYHNNIWEASGFARVLETGSSFFQLVEATNHEKLVTFSSHSMSFQALVEVGFWPVDMISDDSAIFWKSFIHFDGDYHVVPMYVTLSMDVVEAGTWWKTIKNIYKQKQRWAWGVENFPLVMRAFLQNKKIPLYEKIRHGYKLFEGHVTWATWAFLLTFIGWMPAFLSTREFSNSVLYYSSPRITGIIFNLSLFSFFISIILSLYLLPKKKIKHPFLKRVFFAAEWLFVPFIAVFLSALPALDTQTRLMFGKTMGFWVTDKTRK